MAVIMSFTESHIEYANGLRIRCRENDHNNRTIAVFIHDAGESLEDYDYLFPYFDTSGIALNAIELRGHGKSGGAAHHIRDFELYVRDLKRFIFGNLQNKPVYLVAQGIGVFIAMHVALDTRFRIKGLIFVSPMFDIRIPYLKKSAIILISKLIPRMKIHGFSFFDRPMDAIDIHALSDDKFTKQRSSAFTVGFYASLFRQIRRARKEIALLRNYPAMIIIGEDDNLQHQGTVEALATHAFRNSQNLKLCVCKKCGRHIFHERDKLDYVERIIKWIHKQETGAQTSIN
jgi:alpha-beta hydrolase superfamily lysophospholipase